MKRSNHLTIEMGLRARRKVYVPLLVAALGLLSVLLVGLFGVTRGAAASPAPISGSTKPSNPLTNYRFPAYFIEWGVYATTHNYQPADVPADNITQINYAFIAPVRETGSQTLFTCDYHDLWASVQRPMERLVPGTNPNAGENLGAVNQLKVLRRNHPSLQLLMSIGGYTLSDDFPAISSTPASRTHFVNACVAFMQAKGFDGIDVDWEYPALADKDNFTALLQEFRTKLNSTVGTGAPLTIAAGPTVGYNIPAPNNILSWANVMTYDFNGGFSSNTGHNAPLCSAPDDPMGPSYNSNAGIQLLINGGMSPGKLNLGLAYYGRAMQHLRNTGPSPTLYPGRFAPITATDFVRGTWDDPNAPQRDWTGSFDYWDVIQRYTGPFQPSISPLAGLNGYTRYWDNQQVVAFDYRADAVGPNGAGVWMSYDDPQSLQNKVNYARTLGLGGVFAWELSQESRPGLAEHPLTTAVYSALTAVTAPTFTCGGGATPTPTSPASPTRTNTPVNTATNTSTRTPLPTQTPGGPTATPMPPTATNTPVPPTATNTPVPPTQTPGGPTATPVPPTATTQAATATATSVAVCLVEFTDVPVGSTFYSYVRCLACRNILGGYSDGTFRTNNNVTRGQLSKIISNAAGFSDVASGQLFQDVAADSPFYQFVQRLASRGFIGGYVCGSAGEPCGSGNLPYFRPNANATRGQISKIVSNAAGFNDAASGQTFEDVPATSPFYQWIQRLTSRSIMSGYACGGVAGEPCGSGNLPYFRPNSNATRGQTAKIMSNTFFPNCVTP